MGKLILLEAKIWWRNSRLGILFFLFAFFGLTSPVLIYYMKDFIEAFGGTEGVTLLMPPPSWTALIESYYSNVSQIGLFVLVYFIADTFKLKKKSSLSLYYTTVAQNSLILWVPKLVLAFFITLFTNFVGVLSASYVTWVFFPALDFGRVISASLLQTLILITLVLLGSAVAVWTRKTFLAVVSVLVLLVIHSLVQTFSNISQWLPLSLLSPGEVLKASGQVEFLTISLSLGLIILSLVAILLRPLRVKY